MNQRHGSEIAGHQHVSTDLGRSGLAEERTRGEERASTPYAGGARYADRAGPPDEPLETEGRPIAAALREHVERSPLAIAVVDAESQVVRYANPAFRRLSRDAGSGEAGEDIPTVGRTVAGALPQPGAGRVAALLTQARDSGEAVCDCEVEHVGRDGGAIHWGVTVCPVPTRRARVGGGGVGEDLVLSIRDVTDDMLERRDHTALVDNLREVNQQLVLTSLREQDLTERAEAANTAKSRFLATMSHELRTPLAAIIGYEELLATGITGSVTDPQREQLGRIKRSASHLLALIDQVLNLARLEAQREVIQPTAVSVSDLVDWATTLIAPQAATKGLQFLVDTPKHQTELNTDALKVRQILVNLLGNAVKFTDRGEIALTVRTEGNTVNFEIRDTGIGIRSADVERVFDSFWQVEQQATRRAGGSGLGLTVSRRLARLLGGDITVESEWGRGSTFTLHLPLEAPPHPREARASGQKSTDDTHTSLA